jgi:hypothetical protein
MAIRSYKMGPGTVKLGAAGAFNASSQVNSCVVQFSEEVDSTDAIPVITGEEIAEEQTMTYPWSVAFNTVQDLEAVGLVAWSWTNAGTEQAFEFIPNTVGARKVTGTIIVVPINLGGTSKERPRSDVTMRGKPGTMPVLANTP